jgi:THUMP domain
MSTTEANDSSRADRKRKSSALQTDGSSSYYNYKQSHTNNPRRGGPGILFTCETGREFKARREGLEILQQDWERSSISRTDMSRIDRSASASANGTDDTSKSTLEEELATLRRERFNEQSPSSASPFALYETGCKGVVVVLFQQPAGKNSISSTCTTANGSSESNGKGSVEHDMSGDHPMKLWDPVLAVHRIAQDMTEKAPVYTSSRFITRMIPIQTTCYATIADIVMAAQALLQPIVDSQSHLTVSGETSGDSFPPSVRSHTFAIHEKRRFCSQMKREPLITAVGNMVGEVTRKKPWTVQLTNPDYTIWIEICKTLAGISILPFGHLHPRNFNMVEWRLSLDPNAGSVNDEEKDICSKSATNDALDS